MGGCLPHAVAQVKEAQDDEPIRQALSKITKVYDVLSTELADPVEAERAIYDGAIRGALSQLDPFTSFLDPEQFQSMQQQARGVQKGFGAILNVQSGSITVLESVPGSPFRRAGLGPGDRIVRINGHRVAAMDLREIVEVLQQAKDGPVHLSVILSGKVVPDDFVLNPAELPSPSVDRKFLITPEVGYMHVARIDETTPGEIKSILQEWDADKLSGLLLDLRDDPGGSLEPAVAAASLFLREGQAVVSFLGRAVAEKKYTVAAPPLWKELPLVVLINGRTASAAEIIAAALQEHDRAWVTGEPSFGKGVVESVMPLSEDAALALTTARYFTPQGRSVQRPLAGTSLAVLPGGTDQRYFTDSGRPLRSDAGIQPDETTRGWRLDPWTELVGQSTAILNFAQSYIERHGKVPESFEVSDEVLAELKGFIENSGMVVPPQSWQAAVPYLRVRVRTELMNLIYGASKGDEAEMRGDPQVIGALKALGKARQLLQPSDSNAGKRVPGR